MNISKFDLLNAAVAAVGPQEKYLEEERKNLMPDPGQNQARSGLCEWVENKDGDWNAACGQGFTLFDGAPEENHYRYCPNCGKKIVAKPVDVFDEEDP